MVDTNESQQKSIQAVRRGFQIVETISELDQAKLTEIASKMDMPVSTTHTYLQTLVETGYVRRSDDDYMLSLRFLEHGGRTRNNYRIHQVSRSEVDRIARETNEVASVGVEEGGQRVLLYKSEGENALYDNALTGEYTRMHWSALGKALLSQFSRTHIDEIVKEFGLPARTNKTITDIGKLFEDLDRIVNRGYSLEDEERRIGIRSIAVPITDNQESVVAAISISGPKNRINDQWIRDEGVPLLENTANRIEVQFLHGE